jgi:hypothetical protein
MEMGNLQEKRFQNKAVRQSMSPLCPLFVLSFIRKNSITLFQRPPNEPVQDGTPFPEIPVTAIAMDSALSDSNVERPPEFIGHFYVPSPFCRAP